MTDSPRVRTRDWAGVDYYAELGLDRGASSGAVDEAFRRGAKALHPDRNPDVAATDQFRRLRAAHEVLRDPATRDAYDDFLFRVETGTLASRPPGGTAPNPANRPSAAPAPRRRARRPMPPWARPSIAGILVVLGVVVALWAALGTLPSHTAGDSPLAVQITLAIVSLKLVACGLVLLWYPQLRARWHRPQPGPATGSR